jgi:hypothetical protein
MRYCTKGQARLSLLSLLLLTALALLAACGGSSSAPDAHQLIKDAQTAFQKVTSYHFNLTAENAGAGGFVAIKGADGDTLVPDKLQANANALVLGNVVQVKIIAIGSKQYVTDPISGKWTTASNLLDPRTLSDSNTGVIAILGEVQNPSTPQDSTSNGRPCWSIDGKLDAKYLAGITGGGTATGKQVNVTLCIGKSDKLPYMVRVNGVAISGDTDKTVRTFTLSKFNEQLSISAPI